MVPNTPRIAGPYDGNGSATSFPFSFKVFAKADLQIVRLSALDIESTLTLDSDYTVTLNADQDANPGGTVTYPISGAPLAIGERLTIRGALEIEQQTDFTNQGGFYPQTYEDGLDRLTMLVAQLSEENDRSVRVPVSLADVDTALPIPVAGAALIWNEDGTAIVNGVPTESLVALSGFMANVIQAADAAEARSDIGAAADAEVVKRTGAQTIADVKTFSEQPVVPVATESTAPVRKSQLDAAIAPATLAPTLFVPATAVELSSGSSVDLSTAVPSWARELLIAIDSASSSSTGNLVVTLGDSGGLETSGYSGTVLVMGSTTTSISTGLVLTSVSVAAAEWTGQVRLVRIDSGSNSYWIAESMLGRNDAGAAPNVMIGRKQLSGALTTVNLAVSSGTLDGGRAQLFWR